MRPKSLGRSGSELAFCLIPKFVLENMVPPCWRWKQGRGSGFAGDELGFKRGWDFEVEISHSNPNVEIEQRRYKGAGGACGAGT